MDDVIELVVYRIKPEAQKNYVSTCIEHFRQLVMSLEGFIAYEFYQGCHDRNFFVDLVHWRSLEDAENAARQVKIIQQQPDYANYLGAFEKLELFSHFKLLKCWPKPLEKLS